MVTLVAVYDRDGCVGRCDARCYKAKGKNCTCICGGTNHGAGLEAAAENTKAMADRWVKEYAEEKGIEVERVDKG